MEPSERLTFAHQARAWRGEIPVEFLYTAGLAGERFFRTLRESGRLAVTRCHGCGRTYLPPRIYCQECFADLSGAWMEVAPRGSVHTYSVVHIDREGRPLPAPEIIAYVAIEGTDGGLVARLIGIAPDQVAIGLPVEAVLAPPSERHGAITDIKSFRPRQSSGS